MRNTAYRKSENYNPGQSPEDSWNAWRFKIVYEPEGVFWLLFWVNNFFKMINVFATFTFEDGRQLLSCLLCSNFLVYVEKRPKDAEDAEVGELCGCAPPHPVRCPDDGTSKENLHFDDQSLLVVFLLFCHSVF